MDALETPGCDYEWLNYRGSSGRTEIFCVGRATTRAASRYDELSAPFNEPIAPIRLATTKKKIIISFIIIIIIILHFYFY